MRSIARHRVDVATLLSISILTAAAGSSSSPMQTVMVASAAGLVATAAIVVYQLASRTRGLVG